MSVYNERIGEKRGKQEAKGKPRPVVMCCGFIKATYLETFRIEVTSCRNVERESRWKRFVDERAKGERGWREPSPLISFTTLRFLEFSTATAAVAAAVVVASGTSDRLVYEWASSWKTSNKPLNIYNGHDAWDSSHGIIIPPAAPPVFESTIYAGIP
uniref:Uncharacterized protein n=1 Tax=Vespula pensylvanica TaxID=30213 RepID=A0A834PGC3_VESPE|nr:hypothetical protein H0235_001570 [Vespula pensylvanica]